MLAKTIFASGGAGVAPPPAGLSVYVSPSTFSTTSANGAYSTPAFTANPVGGTPPYTYLWTCPDGTVNSATSMSTGVTISGFNDFIGTTIRVEVTDSLALTASDQAEINITFGTLS